jgi:outer membrane protein
MKTIIYLIISVIVALLGLSTKAQQTWSLQKCIEYAVENNIQLKQQGLSSDYAENQLNQAKADRLPNLNGGFSNNYSFGRSLTYPENTYKNVNTAQVNGFLGTEVNLWNGFRLQNTIKQKELDLQATLQELQKSKDDLMLAIAAQYLEILFAEEMESIAKAQTEVTKLQIQRTKQLVDAGSLARGAQLEIEAQLAREELQLVNSQNRVTLAYLGLYQFLELPMSESFRVEKPDFKVIEASTANINSLEVYKSAVLRRPEILSAQYRVESAKKQLDVAKAYQYPNLSFNANYYNLYNDKYKDLMGNKIGFGDQLSNNKRIGLGLSLNIPIFNRFQVKNSISNATLQIADYEYRLQQAGNVLRKDIEQAYTNALAAYNRYISSEKAVGSTREAFRYVEEKFNVGMVNSVEYNQAKNNLTASQSENLQSKYEFIFRSKILDFYRGIKIEL